MYLRSSRIVNQEMCHQKKNNNIKVNLLAEQKTHLITVLKRFINGLVRLKKKKFSYLVNLTTYLYSQHCFGLVFGVAK